MSLQYSVRIELEFFFLSPLSPHVPQRRQRDSSHPSRRMSSSRRSPKEQTHWCSCNRCHGKAVSKTTFYAHGNSVKRTPHSISERTRDLILSLPPSSKAPRTRRPRKRRAEGAVSADEDPPEGSRRVAQSDPVRIGLDTLYMRLKLNDTQ